MQRIKKVLVVGMHQSDIGIGIGPNIEKFLDRVSVTMDPIHRGRSIQSNVML